MLRVMVGCTGLSSCARTSFLLRRIEWSLSYVSGCNFTYVNMAFHGKEEMLDMLMY